MDALLGLAFAPAPRLPSLNLATERNSSAHSSIGTPSPSLHQVPTACRHTVSGTVSLPSRGAFHPFPHGYWFTIGRYGYLALGSGLPSFPRDFSCPVVLRIPAGAARISPTGLSPPLADRSRSFGYPCRHSRVAGPTNPAPPKGDGLGCSPVRSPLLGELFLFLEVLRCFSSPGSLDPAYVFSPVVTRHHAGRVAPFGNPRFSLLDSSPRLIAVLPRPSSARNAKASTVRPS